MSDTDQIGIEQEDDTQTRHEDTEETRMRVADVVEIAVQSILRHQQRTQN